MGQMIQELLASKKFFVALCTVLAWVVTRLGWSVDPTQLTEALYPLVGYVIMQGVADHGKSAAQLNLQAAQVAAQIRSPIPVGPQP